METSLHHAEGDLESEPFRLAPHLLRLTYRWFEYSCTLAAEGCTGFTVDGHDDGHPVRYSHHKGLAGYPKGSVKTEWEAALGLEHLEGPSHTFGTPVVTVAAVDGDQADELVRIAGMMVPDASPLAERLRVDGGRISQRHGRGRMLATTAALGKNDGKRTSLLLADEIHAWDFHGPAGAKRHGILERNTNKRANGRQLNVTTAGWNLETLLGAMYRYGLKVAGGELVDPGFLFEWWEADEGWDLDDASLLRSAIIEANPMCAVIPDLIDTLVRSYHDHKLRNNVDEFCRYHLNRWVPLLEGAWMDMAAWAARAAARRPVRAGSRVVLGFDGSESGDSTAIVGATIEATPHLFVVGCWEQPEQNDGSWRVPVADVEETLVRACSGRLGGYTVAEVASDVSYWRRTMVELTEKGLPIVAFSQKADMTVACEEMLEAVGRKSVTHDDDPRLNRHMSNARRKQVGESAVRICKEHTQSRKWIDLAAAASMAYSRAQALYFTKPEPAPFFLR